jgi:exosome complex component RRP4
MDRKVVVPGDLLSEDAKRSGEGTFVKDGKVYSLLYGLANYKDKINVIPLAGKYVPAPGDNVIGVIKDITFSNWIVDINSPYDGLLHISEFPKRIEADEMSKYLRMGSSIMTRVKDVDPTMKVELTLNDRKLGSIRAGRVIDKHAEEGDELQHLRRSERNDMDQRWSRGYGSGLENHTPH